jgi:hypothetical protein
VVRFFVVVLAFAPGPGLDLKLQVSEVRYGPSVIECDCLLGSDCAPHAILCLFLFHVLLLLTVVLPQLSWWVVERPLALSEASILQP